MGDVVLSAKSHAFTRGIGIHHGTIGDNFLLDSNMVVSIPVLIFVHTCTSAHSLCLTNSPFLLPCSATSRQVYNHTTIPNASLYKYNHRQSTEDTRK